MEVLTRVITQAKTVSAANTTSQNSVYKCNLCRDTGYIITERDNGQPLMKKCSCEDKKQLERLWEGYGVKPNEVKKISEYIPYDELTKKVKEMAVTYVNSFEDIQKQSINSFGLFGQNGAGKSHICIAIGAALLNKKYQVVYMPYVEATKELKLSAMDAEYYATLSNRYQRAKVLIIDDLFKDKTKNGKLVGDITETDIKHFYPIINYRYYNHLPTIFSSECVPEALARLDESIAGRIIEMCQSHIGVFKEAKNNYRLKQYIV